MSNATIELITDNVHVHSAMQDMVVRLCGDRVIVVSDGIRNAGVGSGWGVYVDMNGKRARNKEGTIAGGMAGMNECIKNIRENAGIGIEEAVRFGTENAAKRLGVFNEIGSIEIGKKADIVIFDDDFNIKRTIVDGKILF